MPVFNGTDASEIIIGTSGDDTFHVSRGDDFLGGEAGTDLVIANYSTATNSISGTFRAELDGLVGDLFSEGYGYTNFQFMEAVQVVGSSSNDFFQIYFNGAFTYGITINAGGGTSDSLAAYIWGTQAPLVGSASGTLSNGTMSFSGFERFDLQLGGGNDNIELGGLSDEVEAAMGDDRILGGGGDDTLEGGWGGDRLEGGDGNDRLHADNAYASVDQGSEIDILLGGAGDDFVSIGYGNSADGGSGSDQLSYSLQGGSQGAVLNLAAMFAGGTIIVGGGTITGFESYANIYGGEFADTITTGDAANTGGFMSSGIFGFGGDDTITTGALADGVYGNAGNDILRSGGGNDTLSGDIGNDRLYGEAGDDTAYGGLGDDQAFGGDGNDQLMTDDDSDQLFGEAGDDVLAGERGDDVMRGGTGNDVYVIALNPGTDTIIEDAGAGTDEVRFEGNAFSIASIANVENLTGLIYANQVLTGNALANTIDGGIGDDTMIGGAGDDTYLVDDPDDVVIELAGQGTDQVRSVSSHTLGDHVENLQLLGFAEIDGTGNAQANVIIGNNATNILDGGDGDDRLDGGIGVDGLIGGLGADELIGGNDTGDLFIYVAQSNSFGSSVDTIRGFQSGFDKIDLSLALTHSVSWTISGGMTVVTAETVDGTLTFNVEGPVTQADFLMTTRLVWGTAGNDNLTGSGEGDYLFGGLGADTMTGGLGDDYYFVDNAGDTVIESPGGGTDGVESSISYTLGTNVEDLILDGAAAIDGTGNAQDNFIFGNSANNVISGLDGSDLLYGGGGTDTLAGGAGDDLYFVNSASALVVETSGAHGIDEVDSSISYTLREFVEILVLIGADAIDGTGNSLVNLIIGNDRANVLDGGAGADDLEGGKGDDTYVVDQAGDIVTEALAEGSDTVRSAVAWTLGVNIENLRLTGSAAIAGTGNGLDNLLVGNGAANRLDGREGADTMEGGLGDDTYVVDQEGDRIIEAAGAGTDRVESESSYTLGANIENLTLTGFGVANAVGNALSNRLVGNFADNLLDGGQGADVMEGGDGNDIYVVDNAGDAIIESATVWIDEVRSSITYMLAANLENLILTGNAAINGTGNASNNYIAGNDAANILYGGGGGFDTLEGRGGNDTYVVGPSGGTLIEQVGGGVDTVLSSMSWAFDDSEFENLTLTGTAAIDGYGNVFANVLTGNSAANLLNGGLGADTMIGGAGDDTYVVEDAGDVLIEAAAAGTDTVQSEFSYTLTANLENLTLLDSLAGDTNGTGNALANVITGNSWNNVIDGGAGADTMEGGWGDDIFIVDNVGDVATDVSGVDEVRSSVSFTLGIVVENLTLTGASVINGTGNGVDNWLVGNAAANRLDGGLGGDLMEGGAGNDTYVVDDIRDAVSEAAGERRRYGRSRLQLHAGRQSREPGPRRRRLYQWVRERAGQHADRQRRRQLARWRSRCRHHAGGIRPRQLCRRQCSRCRHRGRRRRRRLDREFGQLHARRECRKPAAFRQLRPRRDRQWPGQLHDWKCRCEPARRQGRRRHHGGHGRRRHLCRRQCRRRRGRSGGMGHRHGAQRRHPDAGGQCREPGPDRNQRAQRHRQRARQPVGRQQRGQYPRWRSRRRQP